MTDECQCTCCQAAPLRFQVCRGYQDEICERYAFESREAAQDFIKSQGWWKQYQFGAWPSEMNVWITEW